MTREDYFKNKCEDFMNNTLLPILKDREEKE